MAAILNAFTVIAMAVMIFVHAIHRFSAPEEILSRPMLAIALVGLIVNLIVVWKLHPHSTDDLNVRSAFLHAVGDSAASVAVVVSGAWIWLTGQHIADAVTAITISVLILFSAFSIFRDAIHILLEGAPKGITRAKAVHAIEQITGTDTVVDLHIWNLCSNICALTVHIVLPDRQMPAQQDILEKIRLRLQTEFKIIHSTIQIESKNYERRPPNAR